MRVVSPEAGLPVSPAHMQLPWLSSWQPPLELGNSKASFPLIIAAASVVGSTNCTTWSTSLYVVFLCLLVQGHVVSLHRLSPPHMHRQALAQTVTHLLVAGGPFIGCKTSEAFAHYQTK